MIYFLSIIFIIFFNLTPIIWCFILSITKESDILNSIIPKNPTFYNYLMFFNSTTKEHEIIIRGLKNSIFISFITLLITIPLVIITSYAFYKYKFNKFLLNLILATIAIPVFTTIIPIYTIFKNLDLLDNMFFTSIIYTSSFLPLNILIALNYFKTLPEQLWEAAQIDGFNEINFFFKIILPLSKPIILTTSLITFLMTWKQYIIPLILLTSYKKKLLTMVISEFISRDIANYSILATTGIIAIIPPIFIAIFFRKFLISGFSNSGNKF